MKLPFSDIPAFRRDPLALLEARAFGASPGFVDLHLGLKPITMVTEPSLARSILKWNTDEIDKGRLVQTIRPLIGDSLIVNTGAAHERSKKAIHRYLQRHAVSDYLPTMMAIITQFVARVAKDGEFVTTDETPLLSLRLGCAAFFGENVLSNADQLALVDAVQTVEAEIAAEMFSPFAGKLPWKAKARKERIDHAKGIVGFVLNEVRRSDQSSPLLESMEAAGLSEAEIVSEFLGLFIAGHHTTGATIGWMLYHMALDPSISAMIELEADDVLSAAERGEVDALKRAQLSEAFARETMRLYPGGWWTSREALKPVEIAGRSFGKGDMFMVSPWVLHRDERYWDNPGDLSLDRGFMEPGYMPFGVGPRVCIGMNVALIELQLIALQVASSLHLSLLDAPQGTSPVPSVALLAPPFRLKATGKTDEAFRRYVA